MDFKLYTSFPEDLEAEWNDLLDHSVPHVPFLRHEYVSVWWQTRGGGEWPQDVKLVVVTARQDGRLVGIAPFFHVPDHHGRPALLPLGAIEISDYLDVIARPEDRPAFLSELLTFLVQAPIPAWQALDFYNLLDNSSTLPALEAAAKENGWSYTVKQLQHSPYIPLPGDWDTYLAGIDKKQRHEIRRKMRRLEENGLPVKWYVVNDNLSIESELDSFLGLMAQDSDKARFLTPAIRETFHLTMHCAFDRGCLNLAFLEIGGIKAAAYLSFDYLGRIWVYNSGIDFRFVDMSPGWVLLGYLLRWANEQHYAEFDFIRGDEDYKYRFGAIDRFVMLATVERK